MHSSNIVSKNILRYFGVFFHRLYSRWQVFVRFTPFSKFSGEFLTSFQFNLLCVQNHQVELFLKSVLSKSVNTRDQCRVQAGPTL